jgi:transcriptional regulator GlxA family with amidase domain
MPEDKPGPLSVALLLGDRFDDLDFFPLFSLLHKSADHAPVQPLAWSCRPAVKSKCGFEVPCRIDIGPEGFDVIAIPGAADFEALAGSAPARELLRRHIAHGRTVYTVCSGADLLERCGLIDGFTVCAHARRLGQEGAAVTYSGAGVVRDRWLTSVGGDGSHRYAKSIECYFRILEDHFPAARDAIVARAEVDSVFRDAGIARLSTEGRT